MAIRDHVPRVYKFKAQVITCDPSTGTLEVAGPDGAARQVALFAVPPGFTWPIEGEFWSIYNENGYWRLGEKFLNPVEREALYSLAPGETWDSGSSSPGSHTHTIAEIMGLQTALDSKASLAGSSTQDFAVNNLVASGVITEAGGKRLKRKQNIGAFSAYAATTTSIPGGDTFTKVTFDSEEWDISNWFASSRFTPQEEGMYTLFTMIAFSNLIDSGRRVMVSIFKNGSEHKRLENKRQAGVSGGNEADSIWTGSCDIRANGTTDYFEVFVRQDDEFAKNTEVGSVIGCRFQGRFNGSTGS